jgi:hypothetical protein
LGPAPKTKPQNVWKFLPSGKLAGAANRSPAELRAWAVVQCGSGCPGRGRWRRMDGAAFKGACPSEEEKERHKTISERVATS